jgi:hypothetical protein
MLTIDPRIVLTAPSVTKVEQARLATSARTVRLSFPSVTLGYEKREGGQFIDKCPLERRFLELGSVVWEGLKRGTVNKERLSFTEWMGQPREDFGVSPDLESVSPGPPNSRRHKHFATAPRPFRRDARRNG